jgi:hypothetical protein
MDDAMKTAFVPESVDVLRQRAARARRLAAVAPDQVVGARLRALARAYEWQADAEDDDSVSRGQPTQSRRA